MAGIGCNTRGNGKARSNSSSSYNGGGQVQTMHYRSGGMVKSPTPKGTHKMPDGSVMSNSAMPMKGKMPRAR